MVPTVNTRLTIVFIFTMLLFILSCDKKKESDLNMEDDTENTDSGKDPDLSVPGETLIFHSGFEPESQFVMNGPDPAIIGKDQTFTSHNDWVKDFEGNPEAGRFSLQYQGGKESMRYAKIITEPNNPENQVLEFWCNEGFVSGSQNGRVQANIYDVGKGLKKFHLSVRLFLTDDFNTLRKYPDRINFLTIAEFWNNINWSKEVPFPFRISVNIGKGVSGPGDLRFEVSAQDSKLNADGSNSFTTIWDYQNNDLVVPIEEWFRIDYYYVEGNRETGSFKMTIRPDEGKEETVFEIEDYTHNTEDPAPDGVTHFNPIKLYTSSKLLGYMRSKEKAVHMYWDDFKLWRID